MIVLGIDPGTANTGYGIVKKAKTLKCLNYNVIHTVPNSNPGERLRIINNKLSKIIKEYKPDVLAIENVYFFKNLKTAIPVSQAKGSILLTAAKKKVPVYEFSPLQVKLAITGNGRADKKEVQKKIKKMLKLKEVPKPSHAADALAIAITYLLKEA
ncbi:MAG: crossover junction endodeoxyribonuclease RuvC [Candidatus Nealsonbacteria bacterium]|nr:MAG: crossover junction endodeoxyribonuclease RuvC [Candidatus Nealsonbacteria bacterium]